MRKIFPIICLTATCLLFGGAVHSQFVNNGATITIQAGGYLFCGGDMLNNAGTFTNNGKLEVQGNFNNSATYNTSTADDSLILSGSGNVTLNAGTSSLSNLWINKTASSDEVKLAGSTSISNKLDYDQGSLTTDPLVNPSFVLSAPATAVFDFAAGKTIIGKVKRTSWTNGASRSFNHSNMLVTTASGVAPTDITVTLIPESAGGDPTQSEREVKRKYSFTQTGGSGFTADIRFPYVTSELNTNVEANLVPWELLSSEWNARLTPVTRDAANDYVSTTGIPASDFVQEWKLADPKYTFTVTGNLRGAWNGTDMNTGLNSGGVLPLSQPYNTTPFSYAGTESVGSIPNANVVDWILVELRKPSSGLPEDAISSTIIGRKAGFLLKNGSVVNTDGSTPITFDISKQGTSFVVFRHRNHLGVISNAVPSNAAGTFTNDFTQVGNNYKPGGASSDPVVSLSGGGGKYGLWAGDANKSGVVNITDINVVKIAIAGSSTGYQLTDINLNNSINVTDGNIAKTTISSSGTGSGARPLVLQTNIPEATTE